MHQSSNATTLNRALKEANTRLISVAHFFVKRGFKHVRYVMLQYIYMYCMYLRQDIISYVGVDSYGSLVIFIVIVIAIVIFIVIVIVIAIVIFIVIVIVIDVCVHTVIFIVFSTAGLYLLQDFC